MSGRTPRRKALAVLAMLATFTLGVTAAVSGPAAAKSPAKTTSTSRSSLGSVPNAPTAHFFVVNATVNAASDHEIVGSSAFPNFTKGAVDNYYSLAHSHVDNSPFAEGTASPADTGPVGQTAAAGNFQQPQYADARWPGDSGKATYGSQGGPYATAEASKYRATAEASLASSGLNGPSAASPIAAPKGFDDRLRQVLAAWDAKWEDRLHPKPPAPAVTIPGRTVSTPVGTVTTPTATVGGLQVAPPVQAPAAPVPAPPVPSPLGSAPSSSPKSRSLAAVSTPRDGATHLASSTLAVLDSKTDTLTTSGESSLGRVSLGGGQIVIEGIHVTASISNDGTAPKNKVAVSIASATIGGVPVTIDKDGVHVSGQGQALPYEQASDALNAALKQAGIKLFLVAPEITKNSCDQTGPDQTGPDQTGPDTGMTTNSSNDQSGPDSTTGSCDETTGTTTTCDEGGTDTGGGTGGTGPGIGTLPTPTPTTTSSETTTTSSDRSDSTSTTTTSSCGDTGMTNTGSACGPSGGTTGTTTTASDQAATTTDTTTTSSNGQFDLGTGASSSGGETVRATGLHVVFTQPVSPPGVPAQFVEHILGEVFLDSLAVPAGPLPKLDLSSSSSSSSSSCLGGGLSGGTTSGGGLSSAGGLSSSGSVSPGSASGFGSTSQPSGSSTGASPLAAFASALRKPLWLLLAYVVWQVLVIGTGVSLWSWRRGGAT